MVHRPVRANSDHNGELRLDSKMGGLSEEIRQGDVASIAPGKKNCHGAAAATGMTHIAIEQHIDGRTADWIKKVSGEQYRKLGE